MLTVKMLALVLSIHAPAPSTVSDFSDSSDVIVIDDQDGNAQVLQGGSRVMVVDRMGQTRAFNDDGSIDVSGFESEKL